MENINLETITQVLGPPKVTQLICPNEYEEYALQERITPVTDVFKTMICIVDEVDRHKEKVIREYSDMPDNMNKRIEYCIQKSDNRDSSHSGPSGPSKNIIQDILSLWGLFAEMEDHTITLYDAHTQITKITQYRDAYIKALQLHSADNKKLKKAKLTEEQLKNDIGAILLFMSCINKINIYDIHNNVLHIYDHNIIDVVSIDYNKKNKTYSIDDTLKHLNKVYMVRWFK